jgi:Fe-S cluster assembly ATP-binding protein
VDTDEVRDHGADGSGKSTLAYAIAGHPAYEITGGQLLLGGKDIAEAGADERARAGLFLAFQYPQAIPGVRVTDFLRTAINAIRKAKAGGTDDPIPVKEFRDELFKQMDRLKVSRELASRYLNDGFSGGEEAGRDPADGDAEAADGRARRDRLGLDIDALKVVAGGVKELVSPEMGAVVITH